MQVAKWTYPCFHASVLVYDRSLPASQKIFEKLFAFDLGYPLLFWEINMRSVWFDGLTLSNQISEDEALKEGGVLAFLDEDDKFIYCEARFLHRDIFYLYFATWPANDVVQEHIKTRPGSRFLIRTPKNILGEFSSEKIYSYDTEGKLGGFNEYAEKLDGTLLLERRYNAKGELLEAIENLINEKGDIYLARHIMPDGTVISEDEYD